MYLVTSNEDNPDARKAGQAARNVPDDPERGERIRSRMAELGLREADVASACDVTISAVQKWKKGTSIRTKNVAALAKVLKWEPRVLLGAHYQHYERRTAGAMRPFEEVAARISELREELLAEIQQLREESARLADEVHELAQDIRERDSAQAGTGSTGSRGEGAGGS